MSGHALGWAWSQDVPPTAKLVLVKLADQANDDGESWPSQRTLAKHTGVHKDTVKRWLRWLADEGLIERVARVDEDGRQRSNVYRLNSTPGGAPDPPSPGIVDPPLESSREPSLGSLTTFETPPPEIDNVAKVYGYWRLKRDRAHPRYKTISAGRRRKIAARLKTYSPEELMQAIDGVDIDIARWPDRAQHDDLTVIFRSDEQVDKFIRIATEKTERRNRVVAATCPECGVGGGHHTADCARASG